MPFFIVPALALLAVGSTGALVFRTVSDETEQTATRTVPNLVMAAVVLFALYYAYKRL